MKGQNVCGQETEISEKSRIMDSKYLAGRRKKIMKNEYAQWRKLDNAALAFPAVTGKNDTRVFRFYCELKEEINEETLQKALDRTLEKYPLFRAVLRKGLFWFYLERRDIPAIVKKETGAPCSGLYIPDKKTLLFRVSYYKNRINFEVFHALTDGTGAMHFLMELVKDYLQEAHPEKELPELFPDENITGRDMEEDSFSQYYSSDAPRKRESKKPAFQLKGEKLRQEDMSITEVCIPVKEIHARAKAAGVSITVFLTAALIWAIHEEVPQNQAKKPIGLMIPVNLRNYFPSRSMANFFGWIEISCYFSAETTFEDILESVKEQFAKELSKDVIEAKLNDLVSLEKNPILRLVPLEIKTPFLLAGTTLGGRSITAIYSNVGIIRMPEEYRKYIQRFGLFASTDSLQLCSCSFGDEMVLSFSSKIPNGNIERNFVEKLKKEQVSCEIRENDFPGQKEERKAPAKLFESFTFLCIVLAVVCNLIDYLVDGHMGWAWFVTAGAFCTWLMVSVAYVKRRNLLKNEMWQLVIVTVAGVLWDMFTGWRGWSVDYLLPLAALAVICSMWVITAAQRLEVAEYMIYLLEAGAFGVVIPLILLAIGVVNVLYPSLICICVSFLMLVWLFLFKRKDMVREMQKKFRV